MKLCVAQAEEKKHDGLAREPAITVIYGVSTSSLGYLWLQYSPTPRQLPPQGVGYPGSLHVLTSWWGGPREGVTHGRGPRALPVTHKEGIPHWPFSTYYLLCWQNVSDSNKIITYLNLKMCLKCANCNKT